MTSSIYPVLTSNVLGNVIASKGLEPSHYHTKSLHSGRGRKEGFHQEKRNPSSPVVPSVFPRGSLPKLTVSKTSYPIFLVDLVAQPNTGSLGTVQDKCCNECAAPTEYTKLLLFLLSELPLKSNEK